MSGVRVICPDCGDTVQHTCHSGLAQALRELLTWAPERGFATDKLEKALVEAGVEHGWIEKGKGKEYLAEHRESPFFGSQAWSYPLFGSKDTARSFHALIHQVVRAAGMDPHGIEQEIRREQQARAKAEADRKTRVQKVRDERTAVADYLKDKKVPLDERIAKLDELLRAQAARHKLVPFQGEKSREEAAHEGYDYLHRWLKTYYGDGINPDINRARIEKLEHEAFEAQTRERSAR